MDWLNVVKLALIAVTPAVVGAVFVCAPRWYDTLSERWPRRADDTPAPIGPPIEQLAVDLRRLLRLHNEVTSSAHLAMRAHRVWSIEAAIAARAVEAARALDVPHADPGPAGTLRRDQLCRLLHGLADAGLVLPATLGAFTRDGRL